MVKKTFIASSLLSKENLQLIMTSDGKYYIYNKTRNKFESNKKFWTIKEAEKYLKENYQINEVIDSMED